MRTHRRGLVMLLAAALVISVALPVAALEVSENGTIAADQVIDDDLFIGGTMVYINGTVTGDVIAVGNQVVVNGRVGGSLIVAAQSLVVNGTVDGSVYSGSASAEFGSDAQIGRNAYCAGYSLITQPGAEVTQDLLAAMYQVVHGGSIGRDARTAGGAVEIAGEVGRDLIVDLGTEPAGQGAPFVLIPGAPTTIAPGLRVASGASIGGELRYTSPSDANVAIAAEPAQGIRRIVPDGGAQPPAKEDGWFAGVAAIAMAILRWLYARARELVTLLLLGALALWLARSRFLGVVDTAQDRPVESAGWGLLVTVGGYVGFAVAAVAIVVSGLILAVISLGGLTGSFLAVTLSLLVALLILFLFTIRWASKLVLIYLVGRAIMRGVSSKEMAIGWPLVVGSLIYVLLRAIPVVGALLSLVVTLVGMGALWLYLRQTIGSHPGAGDDAIEPSTPAD